MDIKTEKTHKKKDCKTQKSFTRVFDMVHSAHINNCSANLAHASKYTKNSELYLCRVVMRK